MLSVEKAHNMADVFREAQKAYKKAVAAIDLARATAIDAAAKAYNVAVRSAKNNVSNIENEREMDWVAYGEAEEALWKAEAAAKEVYDKTVNVANDTYASEITKAIRAFRDAVPQEDEA